MTKRALILVLCMLTALSFAGCKSADTPNDEPDTAENGSALVTGEQEKEPEVSTENTEVVEDSQENAQEPEAENVYDPGSISAQLAVIAENADVWLTESFPGEVRQYSVTDLDGNGRLEITASTMGGTGLYTISSFYEVNGTYDGLSECVFDIAEGESQPDIMVMSAVCWRDPADGVCYYIFEDVLRNGAAESYVLKSALYLTEGEVRYRPLAKEHNIASGDTLVTIYSDIDGYEISMEEYEAADSVYSGCEKYTAYFNWVEIGQGDDILSLVTDSLSGFFLEAAAD